MLILLLRLILTILVLEVEDLFLTGFDWHGGQVASAVFVYFALNALLLYTGSSVMPHTVEVSLSGLVQGSVIVTLFQWGLTVMLRAKKE